MNPFEKIFDVDLKKGIPRPIDLGTLVFEDDNNALKVGSRVFDGETPVALSGSIVGSVIRQDGATVEIDGMIDGNIGYIVLPQAACAYPGPITITIKNVDGTNKGTIGSFDAKVKKTKTGTTVDPGEIIPDVDDLLALIDEMEDVKSSANTAAQNANAAASHSVRYDIDESSTRTSAEKAVARSNIGAASVTINNHILVIS